MLVWCTQYICMFVSCVRCKLSAALQPIRDVSVLLYHVVLCLRPIIPYPFVQVGYVKAEAVQVVQMLLRKYPQWRAEVLPSLQRSGRAERVLARWSSWRRLIGWCHFDLTKLLFSRLTATSYCVQGSCVHAQVSGACTTVTASQYYR